MNAIAARKKTGAPAGATATGMMMRCRPGAATEMMTLIGVSGMKMPSETHRGTGELPKMKTRTSDLGKASVPLDGRASDDTGFRRAFGQPNCWHPCWVRLYWFSVAGASVLNKLLAFLLGAMPIIG